MKPKIDAVSEAKLNKTRKSYIGKKAGQPTNLKICVICGYKSNQVEDGLCSECEELFPIKEETKNV